jgi:O-antigen/teichoic acid export membrane protein
MIKNILANYVGRLWGFISVYLFIPLYIKLLGVEAYGIINFYTVLLSVLLFADAGLSATLTREFARSEDKEYNQNLLYSIERLYLIISLLIVGILFFCSPLIADNLINTDTILKSKIVLCLRLMGLSIAFQFFSTLHNSGLMGLQKQVLANTLQISWSACRSGLVIIPLLFAPDLLTFFYWQIVCNCFFFILNRYQLWKQIRVESSPVFDTLILKNISKFALGMMLMAVVASLNGQLDKLVVSKYLSLKQFSYYSLAGNLAQVSVILINPLTLAILPMLNKIVHLDSKNELKKVFHQYSFIISFISSFMGITLFFYAKDLAFLWTRNEEIAVNIEGVTKILAIGSVFLANQYMPYLLAISNGHTKTNLILGIASILLLLPLLYFFIGTFDFLGAAFPFLIINIGAFVCLGYLVIRKFILGEYKNWLIKDVMVPTIVNLLIYALMHWALFYYIFPYNLIITVFLSGVFCLIVNLILFNKIFPDNKIKESISKFFRKSK